MNRQKEKIFNFFFFLPILLTKKLKIFQLNKSNAILLKKLNNIELEEKIIDDVEIEIYVISIFNE